PRIAMNYEMKNPPAVFKVSARGGYPALRLERLEALGRLGEADQIDEFGTIAEAVGSLRTLCQRDHIIIGIGPRILPAAQQLPEGGDRGGETCFPRRRLDRLDSAA